MPRRTTFWGSTDKDEFLIDEQGNVRWVIIKIKSILHDEGGEKGYNKNIDIDKVWAQAYYLLKSGFQFTLTKEEIIYSEKNNQENFMKITFEEELINKYFIASDRDDTKAKFMTTADITIFLEEFSKKINSNNVGKALKKLKFERIDGYIRDKRSKGYYVIQSNSRI
jgi:predicted P-loop ATPase